MAKAKAKKKPKKKSAQSIRIQVTASHIKRGVPYDGENCPIALAIKEQVIEPATKALRACATSFGVCASKSMPFLDLTENDLIDIDNVLDERIDLNVANGDDIILGDAVFHAAGAEDFIESFDNDRKVKPRTFILRRKR